MVETFFSIIFTKNFDYNAATKFTESNQFGIILISIFYVIIIFTIQYLMKNKKPYNLKFPLRVWNLFLAIFSVFGSFFTGKTLLQIITNNGIVASYCEIGDFWHGISGLWTFFFCYSKVVELGDTLFIVLKKKPLIFLHW